VILKFKMKILILGGTRFLGKKILNSLLKFDHQIWVISRRKVNIKNINFLNLEREKGIKNLKGIEFDLIIDFIAYKTNDILDIYINLSTKLYIFISTTWITRLWGGKIANEFRPINQNKNKLSPLTQNYLIGKYQCEDKIIKLVNKGFKAKILRLPIIFGQDEHTGRLNFYIERINDNKPIIQIKNKITKIQIGCSENIKTAFIKWLLICAEKQITIWEALPNPGIETKFFITKLAKSMNKKISFIDISKNELLNYLPEYLELEPFWREEELQISNSNIYKFINLPAEDFKNCSFGNKLKLKTSLRLKEINYFAKYQ
tara:strand:- start:1166 stop:2116 length:951 start_codon:yes stop_codon:yes gene_type:complete